MHDHELLHRFIHGGQGSEEAFRALVDRHIPMVYSVCLRQLRDPHWAEDVSQAVFILLAKKAVRLKPGVVVGGWLYRTAVFACSNARDLKRTRTFHETRVDVPMNSTNENPQNPVEQAEVEALLDESLTELPAKEREVIIERYFENKTVAEIAKIRGQTVYATEKALDSGLKKVRRHLAKHGVGVSVVLLAGILARQAAASVPAGLAAATTTAAVTGGTGASIGVGVLVAQIIKAGSQAKLLAAVTAGAACLLLATVAIAFTSAPKAPAHAAGGISPPLVSTTGVPPRPATAAEIDDLLGTLRRTEAALRRMDTTALAGEVAFTDAAAARHWELMARLFESDAALKNTALAHFGSAGAAVTVMPTFDARLNEIEPAIDGVSGDFRILGDRAVCRFAYRITNISGGAVYFVRVDNRWRIDAATTVSIILEGSVNGSSKSDLDLLDDAHQQAVLQRMDRLNLALRSVSAAIESGAIRTLEEAQLQLRAMDGGTAESGRAFFSLALRRDAQEQARN